MHQEVAVEALPQEVVVASVAVAAVVVAVSVVSNKKLNDFKE